MAARPAKRGLNHLPVVGLGGSAGSLKALQDFFTNTPAQTGMCFVVVVHLAPDHGSVLPELLQRHSAMPVQTAVNHGTLVADTVYVIPPGKHLTLVSGHLHLTDLQRARGRHVAVDLFFRSLAEAHGTRAIAVVLSGADGDGAIGLKRVKERGGLTIAQDPGEVEQPGMPQSAIATGMVDWVLRAAEMPQHIASYCQRQRRLQPDPPAPNALTGGAADDSHTDKDTDKDSDIDSDIDSEDSVRDAPVSRILTFIKSCTGRDFTNYKRATVRRRITRRMQVAGVASMDAYQKLLCTQPGEAAALVADLLISVTHFFRDPEAFDELNLHLASLFKGKSAEDSIRVWVTACATGEEAYSVAMLLLEQASLLATPPTMQVFACDLDDEAIRFARTGRYAQTITADVSEERLQRFFSKVPGGYLVRREVRELIVFSGHDLLKDAPFTRIDLLVCRNLLIYFNRQAQAQCFELFNFALKPQGLLFLGSSEALPEDNELFNTLSRQHRIYRPKPVQRLGAPIARADADNAVLRAALRHEQARNTVTTLHRNAFALPVPEHAIGLITGGGGMTPVDELHQRLLGRFGPPSALVNADHDVLHLSENAGPFLQLPEGAPTRNLLRLAKPALRAVFRAALLEAEERGAPVEILGRAVELAAGPAKVDVWVAPAGELAPGHFLVLFAHAGSVGAAAGAGAVGNAGAGVGPHVAAQAVSAVGAEAVPANDLVVMQLEQQLARVQARLQSSVQQYQLTNEELKANNEELQAMNEELRSAGEELESGREELQSVNEELTTLNTEFKGRVDELARANSDLQNLMSATQIATIFLDRELRIMRYTPHAVPLFNFIAGDAGRPISDLQQRLDYPELEADAEQVLASLVPAERELRAGPRWLLARVLPYRTGEDQIAGVVLTFIDITDRKSFESALRASQQRLQTLADAVPQLIWTNDGAGTADYFNQRWYAYSGLSVAESVGPGWQAIVHPDDRAEAVAQWQKVQRAGEVFDCEYRLRGADGSYRWFIGRNVPAHDAEGRVDGWFGTATDIEDFKRAEASLRASEAQFRKAIEEAPIPVIMQAEDGQVLQISKTWQQLTGFDADALPNFDAWLARVRPPDAQKLRTDMQRLFEGRLNVLDADLELTPRTGRPLHWVFSASAPGALHDGRRFMVGMVSDVTQRRHAELRLRESQEHLRLVVENAREYAIISMDLQRRITSWNSGAQMLLGYANDSAMGLLADAIFTPEDRAAGAPLEEASKALADGRAADERWHLRQDGSRFWGSGVMMAMRDDDGNALGLVKIFRDQTAQMRAAQATEQARKALHAALQETEIARDQAQAAGKAKDRFLAVLSHELRAPLTPVLLGAQILTRNKQLPAAVRDTLNIIERNARLQAHLVDDLLDVTRIAHGKMELVREEMNLHTAIARAVEVAQPDMEAKGQQLSVQLAATDCRIWGDAQRLQQAFWNLLKNASKFTPEGGQIGVLARYEGLRAEIQVRDNGMGFEPDAAERIFQVFEQGNRSVTVQYGGLGLGLAIAHAVITAHGGTIAAASAGPGQGATFTVHLTLLGGA